MNTGYFWRPLTDGWKLPEMVLAAEFNPDFNDGGSEMLKLKTA